MIRLTGEMKGNLKHEFLTATAEKKRRTLKVLGAEGVKEVRGNIENETAPSGAKWTPSLRASSEGGRTLRKSGALWRSIDAAELDDSTAVVFVNAARFPEVEKYAMIHNFGGVIRSKTGKKLTVPIHKMSRGKTVADMKRYFDVIYVLRRDGRPPVIMGKNGTRGKPVALFVLKDSVKIPKREFMGLSPAAKSRLTARLEETLKE